MNGKRLFFLTFFLFLCGIFLFAEYFHTDLDIFENCPVCQWERSIFAPGSLYAVILTVTFALFFRFSIYNEYHTETRVPSNRNSRAPPLLLSF